MASLETPGFQSRHLEFWVEESPDSCEAIAKGIFTKLESEIQKGRKK